MIFIFTFLIIHQIRTLLQKSQPTISNPYMQEIQQNHQTITNHIAKMQYIQPQIPPPYSIAVTYRKERRLYTIPVNMSVNELLISLKRVFAVEEQLSVYLYMKRCRRLLSGFARLSELAAESTLLTEFNGKDNNPQPGQWNEIMKSHQFKPQEIIKCKPFIEFTMDAVEVTG